MSVSLAGVLAQARFPVYGIHPRHWPGTAFLGDVGSRSEPEPWLHDVHLMYLDNVEHPLAAATVSTVDAALVTRARDRDEADPLAMHLTPFVSRLDPKAVVRKVRRKRFDPFPRDDFRAGSTVVPIAGESLGAEVLTHTTLPLQLVRVVIARGPSSCEVAIASWHTPVMDLVPLVEPVTLEMAQAFDGGARAPYPPPEWALPEE